jgi:hypothetical protein
MYAIHKDLPVFKAASLWQNSAAIYGGMHPAEIMAAAIAEATDASAVIAELDRAWYEIPVPEDPYGIVPQRVRLSRILGKAICMTFGGGRSTVHLTWTPGTERATLSVRWVPTTGFVGENYSLAKSTDDNRLHETRIRQFDPRATWREFQPRFEAAGFKLHDLVEAREALGDNLDVEGQALNELVFQNEVSVDNALWVWQQQRADPRINFMEETFHRVIEGRLGRPLEKYPGDGISHPFATDGICHALGHNLWRWEGTVVFAHPSDHSVHFKGTLFVLDEEGNEIDDYEYSRTWSPKENIKPRA